MLLNSVLIECAAICTNGRTLRMQIMGMLPMFSNMDMGKGMDKETQSRFRKYETMMDSMRDAELDESDVRKLYDLAKMRRIARGSGSSLVCPP